ncbi:MAG: purine-binding chemotaxis protein CheW [Firmicutes bacterium]|nr:purine-binding chemotaxis protein CheW [Bacillota bacterium]
MEHEALNQALDAEKDSEGVVEARNVARFLTFLSDGLYFGVNTRNVIEIINNHQIRTLPMVPDYVRGIINLRGQVIPIIDMRLRMGKPFQEYTPKTCIVILEIDSNTIGIVVDSVAQVLDIDLDRITPIPTENRQELTNSMISIDGTVILLLECEAIVENQM